MTPNCTRLWLVKLGSSPEGKKLMDVGITHNQKQGMKLELVSCRRERGRLT